MPDPLFDSLVTDSASVRWASTAHLRDRARQRTRRTRIASVAAAFVAIAAVVGGVAAAGTDGAAPPGPPVASGGESATPTAPPSATQSPSAQASGPSSPTGSTGTSTPDVTAARFLQPADLGTGWRSAAQSPQGSGDWTVEFGFQALGCGDLSNPAPMRDLLQMQSRELTKNDDRYLQWVGAFRTGNGARYVESIRDRADRCVPTMPNGAVRITAERFAGHDALVVDFTFETNRSRHVVVRHGDLVTEVWTKTVVLSDSTAKDLGQKAAARLAG